MLVLTRKRDETIVVNGPAVIRVLDFMRHGQVRIGIDAPATTVIRRGEHVNAHLQR